MSTCKESSERECRDLRAATKPKRDSAAGRYVDIEPLQCQIDGFSVLASFDIKRENVFRNQGTRHCQLVLLGPPTPDIMEQVGDGNVEASRKMRGIDV